mgnify:FL=1
MHKLFFILYSLGMYLLSLYFDDKTNAYLTMLKKHIYKKTGIHYDIPFHITLLSFQSDLEDAYRLFESINFIPFELQFVSIGFLNTSIILIPIMKENLSSLYRQGLNSTIYVNERYKENNWFAHLTLSKHLSKEQLLESYQAIQYDFKPFIGKVTKIGLAKSNPYEDIMLK